MSTAPSVCDCCHEPLTNPSYWSIGRHLCRQCAINHDPSFVLDEKLKNIRALVTEWLSKQGHDACWYYPDVFRQIATVLGIEPLPVGLPPRCEFEAGCKRYQDELYAPPSDDDEPISREWMREEYGDTRVVVGLFTVTLNVRRATISVVCGACKNVVVRSVPAKTRRQLRDLLAALGYSRGEG